jgi:hypothetical protein
MPQLSKAELGHRHRDVQVDRDLHRLMAVNCIAGERRHICRAPAVDIEHLQRVTGIAIDPQDVVQARDAADVGNRRVKIEHIGQMQREGIGMSVVDVEDFDVLDAVAIRR